MESITKLGIGIFKGRSLCLTELDASNIHKKFYSLYTNKGKKD